MDSTFPAPAERRRAHRRVGAAAIAAFLAFLLLAAVRGPAEASPTSAPTLTPGGGTVPQDGDGDGGFRGRRDGGGRGGFGGPPGAGSDDGGGFGGRGGTAPGGTDGSGTDDFGGPGGGGTDDGGLGAPDGSGQTTPAPSTPSTSGGTQT